MIALALYLCMSLFVSGCASYKSRKLFFDNKKNSVILHLLLIRQLSTDTIPYGKEKGNFFYTMKGSAVGTEERKSKKQKKEGPPEPPENWDRCRFYVERKNRFCKQWPTNGNKYCGNHQHLEEEVPSSSESGNKKKIRKRIPCPIDPSQ